MNFMKRMTLTGLVCFSLAGSPAMAQTVNVPFDSDQWIIKEDKARVEEHMGRQCLFLQAGEAWLKDVDMRDGVVEVDIAPRGGASVETTSDDGEEALFTGVIFRVQSPGEFEDIYIRHHQSNKDAATQYTPRFNNMSAWQLYTGEGYTANANIPQDRWIQLKVVVDGLYARLHIDGAAKPALTTARLRRGDSSGSVGVQALWGGYFTNFRYTPMERTKEATAEVARAAPQPPADAISRWQITEQLWDYSTTQRDVYPGAEALAAMRWETVTSDETGLVNISRYHPHPGGPTGVGVYGRAVVYSEADQVKKVYFGYSDEISVFCNGQILFTGNCLYRSREPTFLGVVRGKSSVGFDAVYLNLRKGENELLIASSEAFGGWGFRFIFDDKEGLTFN